MATRKGLIGIFGSRSVNLVVFNIVREFPRRYHHKCLECGRTFGVSFNTNSTLLKNFNVTKSEYFNNDAIRYNVLLFT